jgi:hypothetical protein
MIICLVTTSAACHLVSPEPDVEQIKSDLIGETISQGEMSWYFAALSEFKEVTIVDKIREGDTIEYNLTLELQDVFTEKMYTAEILLIYKRSGTSWGLFSILPMLLESSINNEVI